MEELFLKDGEFQAELNAAERQIRDQFVVQYLQDYNSVLACIRLGFQEVYARTWGPKLLAESYTQRKLQETINGRKAQLEENTDTEHSQIIEALRREANYYGPGASQSARVAALAHLAKLTGMEPAGKAQEVLHRGGVMLVPATADIGDWQAAALASQQALQKDAGA